MFIIIGNVVSIVVAPPTDIMGSGPNNLYMAGASRRAAVSRIIFDSNAIVPYSGLMYCVMIILDRE